MTLFAICISANDNDESRRRHSSTPPTALKEDKFALSIIPGAFCSRYRRQAARPPACKRIITLMREYVFSSDDWHAARRRGVPRRVYGFQARWKSGSTTTKVGRIVENMRI